MIYEHDRNITHLRIELTPAIRHVIIKGAPQHLWLMLKAALSGHQFVIQIVEYFMSSVQTVSCVKFGMNSPNDISSLYDFRMQYDLHRF